MPDATQLIKKNVSVLVMLVTIISITAPFLILYFIYPRYLQYPNSFEITWKGRMFYLFFLWLFFLEMILGWEELKTTKHKLKSIRTATFIIALLLPVIYVIIANNYGLNKIIVDMAWQKNIRLPYSDLSDWMPLSTEYLVFTVLSAFIILLGYGIKGVTNFSISIVFLGVIGFLYTIDNLYPYGKFTPFQFLVPTTTMLAAGFLNLMGYQTSFLSPSGDMPYLKASNSSGSWGAYIAWPCSGIDSLLIYSVTILLFLKRSVIPRKQKIIYFIIGAIVTYFINVLRIVTIFVIGINGGDVDAFHNIYGQLYSITWIVSYPLLIIGTRALWGKIRHWRTVTKNDLRFPTQANLSE